MFRLGYVQIGFDYGGILVYFGWCVIGNFVVMLQYYYVVGEFEDQVDVMFDQQNGGFELIVCGVYEMCYFVFFGDGYVGYWFIQ